MNVDRTIQRVAATIVGAVAAVLLIAGLIVGFMPLHADATDCGSAFKAGSTFFASGSCDQLRSQLGGFAWPALASALVFGLTASVLSPPPVVRAAGMTSRNDEERPAQPEG